METRVLIWSASKPNAAFSPTPMMLQIKFGCNRPAGLGYIHVWKCGRTDGRTPALVPFYKLTLWAFGSGELKKKKKKRRKLYQTAPGCQIGLTAKKGDLFPVFRQVYGKKEHIRQFSCMKLTVSVWCFVPCKIIGFDRRLILCHSYHMLNSVYSGHTLSCRYDDLCTWL